MADDAIDAQPSLLLPRLSLSLRVSRLLRFPSLLSPLPSFHSTRRLPSIAMPPAVATAAAVGDARLGAGNRYSVLLPTYNERQNLPIMIDLLVQTFTQQ